jgi:protocatechuate 3,4-dioxygenase beta subunit
MEDTNDQPIVTRRWALTLLGGAGVAALIGCSSDDNTAATGTSSSTARSSSTSSASAAGSAGSAGAQATEQIAEETAGPYPGDGSNGPNLLTQDGVVRSDITTSFGSMSGTAAGVPTTIELTITDLAKGAPYKGAAVYIWHCDKQGRYSLYSQGATNQNYLRGVQEADSDGKVTFLTIFPAAYSGRWPHVHFEVYPSLADAKSVTKKIATSQIAIPEDICNAIYATSGYEQSVQNMKITSLARDNVFSDGVETETPTVSGDASTGVTLTMAVGV